VSGAVTLTSPLQVQAALGEQESSIETDQLRMKSSFTKRVNQLYTVHELVAPYGTTVMEYSTHNGLVFAVSWHGPHQPELRQLLGSYFNLYKNAPRSSTSSRNQASVNLPNLVVLSAGHMRAFSGIAYDPKLLPNNLNLDEIK